MEHKVILNLSDVKETDQFPDNGTKVSPQPLNKLEVHMMREFTV